MSNAWGGRDSEIAKAVRRYSDETLAAYREAPRFVEEHANLERAAIEGGYGRRQLFELIQNGADELVDSSGRVQVLLTEEALYCANEGKPLTVAGVGALLSSHLSSKTGVEIGRFGLGFKSVLAISTRPEIFSRSGSLRFDPVEAARRIREVVPGATRTPVLRIAEALDAETEAEDDGFLAELMSWATTVVRLRRDTPDSSWLGQDMESFPSQFLLFSQHVEQLVLDDQEARKKRAITSRHEGAEVVLDDGDESRWRVFSVEHHPTPTAKADGGAMADRERIPLVWAVPTRAGRRGEFWAFFPTLDRTTLSGVVNAPWKLNEDRTRVIEGPFNAELVESLSTLILENLQPLVVADDPCVLLDLLPARGREAAGWADDVLTAEVNARAKTHRTLPDQKAKLRRPAELMLHPDGIPRPTLEVWAKQPSCPLDWVHISVESTPRRARAVMYMDDRAPATVGEWLEALVPDDDPVDGCLSALEVASSLVRIEPRFLAEVRQASILLDDAGQRCSIGDGLFLPAPIPVEVEARYVHPALAERGSEWLRNLDVREVDTERLLTVKLGEDRREWTAGDWDLFWELVRECEQRAVLDAVRECRVNPLRLRVRNGKGDYHPIGLLLLPGEIAHEGSTEDAKAIIDTHFHRRELSTLRLLGATGGPGRNGGSRAEPWFIEYRRQAEKTYLEELAKSGAAPSREYLDFRTRPFAGPLTPLMMLSPETRARYAAAVLRVAEDLSEWTFAHKTQTRYPERPWPNPAVYMIRKYGFLETSLGPTATSAAVAPELEPLSVVLPVARVQTAAAVALGLVADPAAVPEEQWQSAFDAVAELSDDRRIGIVYAIAATAGVPPPKTIRCRVGNAHDVRPTETVTVVADAATADLLKQAGEAFVEVGLQEQQLTLLTAWQLRDPTTAIQSEVVATASGEAEALADAFPMLRPRLDVQQRAMLLQPCSDVRIDRYTDSGRVSDPQQIVIDGDTIYYRDELELRRLLLLISSKLGLALSEADADAVFRNLEARKAKELRAAIRAAADDAARVLLAIGAETLRAHMPRAVLSSVENIEGDLDDRGIAELALVLYGTQVLQQHVDVLEERGLEPPLRWAGGRAAVAFARELGFGNEFGGFENRSLERQLEVEGPPELGDLHDYQKVVVTEIRELLRGEGGLRGLLSLPTGAGKTRVTIEALIDAMVAGELGSPILWVAQTEELCEQAIETWSELWRAKGPRERLTISRLRASFEAEQAESGQQVVVATIQKLDRAVFGKKAYEWLSRASCIVVDEAHTSIGPSYTELLEWQGMALARGQERAPLIGLTATPYRGTNVVEGRRLVARYGNRRLDLRALGGADAYPHLQRIGILSQVDHELLPGSEIRLSGDELKELKQLRQFPDAASRRLAVDTERNRTLLDSITGLEDDWPVLLFAVSVEHANTMAALLSRAGVSAAAVSADTGKGLRRHYIERFRRGGLRVLTNYGVLAAGFDAPKVRAVYIARPTYVPNVYQQMIGRGLRGPRNQGTERCLLVNVADNIEQFGESLAFHEFDYLWGDSSVPVEA